MKWSQYDPDESQRSTLLREVVEYIISGEIRVAAAGQYGFYFDGAFWHGGIGGDPRWEFTYEPTEDGLGAFLIYSDPETSSSNLGEAVFSVKEVFDVFEGQLAAYAECYPEHRSIVEVELAKLPAYREGLKS